LSGTTNEDRLRGRMVGRFGQQPDLVGRNDRVVSFPGKCEAAYDVDSVEPQKSDDLSLDVWKVGAPQRDAGEAERAQGSNHGRAGRGCRFSRRDCDSARDVEITSGTTYEAHGRAVVGESGGFILEESTCRFLDVAVFGQPNALFHGVVDGRIWRPNANEVRALRQKPPELVDDSLRLEIDPGIVRVNRANYGHAAPPREYF